MAVNSLDRFPTIRTEGAILPADLLQRVAASDSSLPGLTPASYHLVEGEKLNEATNRAWNRLLGVWTTFQKAVERLPSGDTGTSVTRDRWLLPLFQELGYGRLLQEKPQELEGKTYPITHAWQHTPIHMVGCRDDLDRRTAVKSGGSLPSPHSLVQELLNRSEDNLWAFATNGLRLRILRDNNRLTRQAFVEFDLQAMFEGKLYTDFALLWRLCHQSRVEAEKPSDCWLEQWSKAAQQQGLRILDLLRDGVEKAIATLGRGFLACPANSNLRESLRAGRLDAQDYYRQLLRLVYRLLFLFVAEDRELIFDPEADEASRDRYTRFYSTARLRQMAERLRGTQHTDLYRTLHLVMSRLGSPDGCPELGLPALGGFLFAADAMPDLAECQLANTDLLDAVRTLALTSDGHALRAVDYRNLGSEELGSIYESLLELHPELNAEAATFELRTASGHERKTTGSYYTPTSLITCLLDSALDPVLDEAVTQPDPQAALRNLKICDPACGSGHFLIAAAHRLAKRLAYVRTGEEEPPPQAIRTALRDVIGHCIYGVDINPMAVELCKVALWMEALEPGKPLSFLDHHIQCGNSLLGTTPALLAAGIPDDAFKPIEGDVKSRCADLKRENKRERQEYEAGQGYLFDPVYMLGNLPAEFAKLNAAPDASYQDIAALQRRHAELVRGTAYKNARLWTDTWCAAFVWKKDDSDLGKLCPTERDFRNVERNSEQGLLPHVREEVQRLSHQYQLFHWHLAYPEVFPLPANQDESPANAQTGWNGGFDVVLGNPPWERIKLQEREWFAERAPWVAEAANAARRRKLIAELAQRAPAILNAFLEARRQSEGESHLVRDSGVFPLCGRGDVNTYSIFAELNRSLIGPHGAVGCIVPTGIATDDTTKLFFADLVNRKQLMQILSFFEIRLLFPATDSRSPFCLLALSGTQRPTVRADFSFFATSVDDLNDPQRRFTLSAEEIELLNPNTRTCPIFRTQRDAEITKAAYRKVPVLIRDATADEPEQNPWNVSFLRMLDMANSSDLFRTREQLEAEGWHLHGNQFERGGDVYLPLYEAKMTNLFDHRHGSIIGDDDLRKMSGVPAQGTTLDQHRDPMFQALPRYWVPQWEVIQRTADVPPALFAAYAAEDEPWLEQIFWHWLAGYYRNRDQADLAEDFLERLESSGDTAHGSLKKWPTVEEFEQAFPLDTDQVAILSGTEPAEERAIEMIEARTPRWFVTWRDVARSTDVRTAIHSILPRVGIGHKAPVMRAMHAPTAATGCLYANLNCYALDYFVRQSIGGASLSYFIVKQLPVLEPDTYNAKAAWDDASLQEWLVPRVLELTYTAWDLQPFAVECGYDGPPFIWEDERRLQIRCELDAAFFHLYGINRDDADYILETFPIVKRKDVERFGRFETKARTLEIYDALADAIRTGQPYQSKLNPLPGPPTVGLPVWNEGDQRPADWPSHIHPPRHAQQDAETYFAPAIHVPPSQPIDTDVLIQAFLDVRDGRSPDFVVACPESNQRFLERARDLGIESEDYQINLSLLNARKASKLKGQKTERPYRLSREIEPWVFAAEWAMRHLQRELHRESNRLIALDEILCNPQYAARFDALVTRIKPDYSPLEYRWAALGLRKKGKAKPDDDDLAISLDRGMALDEALERLPQGQGLYLVRAQDCALYVNHTDDLRGQLHRHLELAGSGLVPDWLLTGTGPAVSISYAHLEGMRPERLREVRITSIARFRPWLNLLDVDGPAADVSLEEESL